ncbi:MAG TPA: YihY/virulence factor BrkB family protein [Gemmataceae bacterium]|nr:YihY/virulence factor BrkB family protein [Gemmataceae bacterium]
MRVASLWPLLKETAVRFWHDRCPRLGAALAFYTALSLSPTLLVVVAIAGAVYGDEAARGELAEQIQGTVGPEGAKAIETMLANTRAEGKSTLMTIVGVATLLVGATGLFAQLQEALDTIWDVTPEQAGSGIWAIVKDRAIAFSIVLALAFLLLVSLVLSAVLTAANTWMADRVAVGGWGLQAGNQVLTFLLTAALFAIIFKVLPHARPAWSDVAVGALLTAALFTLGKYLIGLYLAQAAPGSAYGAAGSFVVLLIWVYYSTQILLFGAVFTHVYAIRHGTGKLRDLREGPSRSAEPGRPTLERAAAGAT